MVELGWFAHQQLVVDLVPHWDSLVSFHDLQQNLVPVLVSEQFDDGFRGQSLFQPVEAFLLDPVAADTLVDHTRAVLLNSELREPFGNHLSDSGALVFSKEFVAELDNVVSEGVLDDLVDTEGDFIDELLFGFGGEFLDFL